MGSHSERESTRQSSARGMALEDQQIDRSGRQLAGVEGNWPVRVIFESKVTRRSCRSATVPVSSFAETLTAAINVRNADVHLVEQDADRRRHAESAYWPSPNGCRLTGTAGVGQWQTLARNIHEDYRKASGRSGRCLRRRADRRRRTGKTSPLRTVTSSSRQLSSRDRASGGLFVTSHTVRADRGRGPSG